VKFRVLFLQTLLVIFVLVYIYPILLSIGGAFKWRSELFEPTLNPFPINFTLHNFVSLFEKVNVLNVLKNSMIIAIVAAFSNIFLCPLTAYPLAKSNFKGKRFFQLLVIFSMVQPFIAISIPLLGIVVMAGLQDTLFAATFPFLIYPMIVYFFMQSLTYIPDDLIDSARLDGAGELTILYRILLPIIKATVGGSFLLTFIWIWNFYLWQLMVLRTTENMTYPVAVGMLSTSYFIYYGEVFALTSLYIVPLLIIFLIMQKQIVSTMVLSGIKG